MTTEESLRGRASGVALLSSIASRKAELEADPTWNLSTRILHCIVYIRATPVQIVVVYCKPSNSPDSLDFNKKLLTHAWTQVRKLKIPFIIMGDFNMPIPTFDVWETMKSAGCQHLEDMYVARYQVSMPHSCASATNPDMAILSAELTPWLSDITVMEEGWLATHRPIIFSLTVPDQGPFQARYRQPKQLVDLCLDTEEFEAAHQEWQQRHTDTVDSLNSGA